MGNQKGYEAIVLSKSSYVTEMMESQGISDDDVKMVIHNAETTGEKLYDADSNELFAQLRIGEATFFVKYEPKDEGVFDIITTSYCKSEYPKE